MAESETIVAITLIFIGVFYILERMFHLTALCYSWFYGDNVINGGNSEPGEEIPKLNNYKTWLFIDNGFDMDSPIPELVVQRWREMQMGRANATHITEL